MTSNARTCVGSTGREKRGKERLVCLDVGAYWARNSISRRGEGAPGRAPGNELHQLALADALQCLVDLCIWVKAHGWTMSMLVWVSDRTTTLF